MVRGNGLTKGFISVIFLICLASLSFASMIPSTEPCWVKGTVVGDGISINGLTATAYYGDTNLKSQVLDANGILSLNSVGATTGKTISIKVLGVTFKDFNFVGYCKDEEQNPWIDLGTITVSKQANGSVCTADLICTSGYCSSGTCQTRPSGGTPSGGGGGGIGLPPETVVTTIVDTNETFTPTAEEIAAALEGSGLSSEEIAAYVEAAKTGGLEIDRSLKVDKTTTGGSSTYKSTFTIVITNKTGKDLSKIFIVETVPKNIAATASEITSIYAFKVIAADPVLEFTIAPLSNGQSTKVTYSVNNNVAPADFNSMSPPVAKFLASEPVVKPPIIDTNKPTTPGTDTNKPSTETPTTPPMDFTIIILAIVVILVIAGAAYLLLGKKKGNNLGN